ncbi:MAG: transcription-repair coupling factor [Myxococcota bacterium]
MLADSQPGKPIQLDPLPPAGLAYLLARDADVEPVLVVVESEDRAENLTRDLEALGEKRVTWFPGSSHTPFEDVSFDPSVTAARLALRAQWNRGERPRIMVAAATALQDRWTTDSEFHDASHTLVVGEEVDRDGLLRDLTRAGYQRVNLVEDEGTFSVRGGIIDVFPPARVRPLRIDLFGDEIASLKSFDPDSQRTFDKVGRFTLHPIREVVFDEASVQRGQSRLNALAEDITVPSRRLRGMLEDIGEHNYFFGIEGLWPAFYSGSDAVISTWLSDEVRVVLEEPERLGDALEQRYALAEAERDRAIERGQLAVTVGEHLVAPREVLGALEARSVLDVVSITDDRASERRAHRLEACSDLARDMKARREDPSRGEILEPLSDVFVRASKAGHDCILCCQARGQAERVRELLKARGIDLPLLEGALRVDILGRTSPTIGIGVAALGAGLYDRENKITLLSDAELLGHVTKSRRRRRKPRAPRDGVTTLRDLKITEPVVHVDHGIGRYQGLKRLILNGVDGDYVHLDYADGDKLYLPVYRLNLLQRYQGSQESVRLDKLGGTRWERAKQRVKDAVLSLAHELLAVQAQRKMRPGFKLPPPDDLYRDFESRFPFEETPDQARAIEDVLKDLVAGPPMDRLIVGDVGFGKTEVAMRATFRSVSSGKQVAVLVPTTVLAEQHGIRFRERFEGLPVRVEVLSRFRSTKESKAISENLRDGSIDVLIGTHRMLSADVGFKDLGLLVIDEEQRFGVRQKERIKQLRSNVHVLAMSATPIPRTLHMASVGLRDLSIIQTPPAERTGIRTEVTRFDEAVIREAIRRELTRGGQVFVVHNRVSSIDPLAELVRKEVPEARVVVAHGKMNGPTLERIMVDFVHREYNVMVCTAIIESGIDIPSVNTMIVDRADHFGLSQLYQLRGRIGRGRDRAYAYLLLPRGERIHREAAERLRVLKRFSELGSGFQIASQDLELRGAGDLLGKSQSGHIAAVGYELYTELLGEAVERARGQSEKVEVEPEIKLPVTAVLPEKYLPDPMLRLDFYQRMASSESDEAVFDVLSEIEERYGAAPDEVEHLAEVMVLRRRLKRLGATALSAVSGDGLVKVSVSFVADPALDRADLARRAQREPNRYRLLPSGKLGIIVDAPESTDLEFLRLVRHEVGLLKVDG